MARWIGIHTGDSISGFTGMVFMLCVVASIAGVAAFVCGRRSVEKKKKETNRKRPDITYYGATGGAYASDYYGGRGGKGRNGNIGLGVAAGVGTGIATAVVLDAALHAGGGCGGGGCGGGGCGGGGCGGGGCGGGGCGS